MKVGELIRLLEGDGWRLVRTKGSHRQFKNSGKPGTVKVAGKLSLPEPFMVTIGGHPFPVLWSIIGAALFVAIIHLVSRRP